MHKTVAHDHGSGLYELDRSRVAGRLLSQWIGDVARESSVRGVATRIIAGLVKRLGARSACVHLARGGGGTLVLEAARHADGRALACIDVANGDHPAARAVRTGLLQLEVHDGAPKGAASFAFPLLACARPIGAVSATFDALSAKDAEALGDASDVLGALVERHVLREELQAAQVHAQQRVDRAACVVHDVRQPLNVITLSAAALVRGIDPKAAAERLSASTRLLERVIDDLADVTFLETGRVALRRARTRVEPLVASILARHAPDAERAFDAGDAPVCVDPHRLEQVLMNLLGNAKKHGDPRAAIRVDVERRGAFVVVTVSNGGAPIAPGDLERIFDPYYRGANADHPGLGLGLPICRRLVEQHGGRIWAEGDAASTRFLFSLPIANEPCEPPITPRGGATT